MLTIPLPPPPFTQPQTWQLNLFYNNFEMTPEKLDALQAAGPRPTHPVVAPAGVAADEPFLLGEAGWHYDVDTQPVGGVRFLTHTRLTSSGASTGTWVRTPTGDLLLPTGPGFGLAFNAHFLAVTQHKVHAPDGLTLTAVGNATLVGTKRFVAAAPTLAAFPALPTSVEGKPLGEFLASVKCEPSKICNNFHDMVQAGAWGRVRVGRRLDCCGLRLGCFGLLVCLNAQRPSPAACLRMTSVALPLPSPALHPQARRAQPPWRAAWATTRTGSPCRLRSQVRARCQHECRRQSLQLLACMPADTP